MSKALLHLEKVGKSYAAIKIGKKFDFKRRWDLVKSTIFNKNFVDDESFRSQESRWAIQDVSFKLLPGTNLGIVGNSGSGKSTLLKVIGSQTCFQKGKLISRARILPIFAIKDIFDSDRNFDDCLKLCSELYDLDPEACRAQADKILDFSELRSFRDTPIKKFSSGMKLRLAFSLGLHLPANIVLLDDNFAVGDSAFQQKCIKAIIDASRDQRSFIICSRDLDLIKKCCHELVILDKGRCLFKGACEEGIDIFQNPLAFQKLSQDKVIHETVRHEEAHIRKIELLNEQLEPLEFVTHGQKALLRMSVESYIPNIHIRPRMDFYAYGDRGFRTVGRKEQYVEFPQLISFYLEIPANLLSQTSYTLHCGVIIRIDDQIIRISEFDTFTLKVGKDCQGDSHDAIGPVISPEIQHSLKAISP